MIRPRAASVQIDTRRAGAFGLIVLAVAALALSGCNTTEGVGRDVSATGHAVTRGASEVKSGL